MSAVRSISETVDTIAPSIGEPDPEPDAYRCRNCGRDADPDATTSPNCSSTNLRPLYL